jgi:hypothetical protein
LDPCHYFFGAFDICNYYSLIWRRKQHAKGKMHKQAAWIGTGREEGGSEMHPTEERCSSTTAHTANAADGWRVGVRIMKVRERVGDRGIKGKPSWVWPKQI